MTEKIVALDIGSSSLKGIEATIKNGVPVISRIETLALDTHIVESGAIVSAEGLEKAVAKLFREAKFTTKNVATFVSGQPVVIRVVDDLPWAQPHDFKKLLPYIAKQKVPFNVDEYYLDAHTLDEYQGENDPTRMKKALVSGAERKYVDTLIKTLAGEKLSLHRIDSLPFSLIRAFAFGNPKPDGPVTSVELGSDTTTIVIHNNFQPAYVHSAPGLGSRRITERLSQELHLSFPEAEFLKIIIGLPNDIRAQLRTNVVLDGNPKAVAFDSFTPEQIHEAQHIISQEVSNLISHINDIIDDSLNDVDTTPTQIVLTGGGAGLATLKQRLSNEVGIPTSLLKPFGDERSKTIPEAIFAEQHRYAAVFGLLV